MPTYEYGEYRQTTSFGTSVAGVSCGGQAGNVNEAYDGTSWSEGNVVITNSNNSKSDMMVGKGIGCLFITWSENGNIYAHCLREDGTLGSPDGSLLGDINNDGNIDVLDVVILVNYILNGDTSELDGADINNDGEVNVLDIVALVNIILSS